MQHATKLEKEVHVPVKHTLMR